MSCRIILPSQPAHLLHRLPWRVALIKNTRGVIPVCVVLDDLAERGKHRNAAVLEFRGTVPLHLLGGAVLAEPEGVKDAPTLNVVPDDSCSLDRVWHYGPSRAFCGHLQAASYKGVVKKCWRTMGGGMRKEAVVLSFPRCCRSGIVRRLNLAFFNAIVCGKLESITADVRLLLESIFSWQNACCSLYERLLYIFICVWCD